ncbi:hypothetical protein SLS64_005196 [Diaporthe eres]|uniref:Uncharacterized protein n=1 Tax=Diaporthe eres TaxID=83184 RepID=A0ABR1P2U7_DIAER
MTTTIYDSFNQALPSFLQLGTQVEIRAKPSGTTTAECTPPSCGINIPLKHWADLASDLCLEKYKDELRSAFLPTVDSFIEFKSEADVADASTLYLTHPVHVAYQLVHSSDQDRRVDQLTIPLRRMTPSSRVDRAYFSGRPSNEETPGNSSNVFAVLEYKKFQGLSRDQFNRGMVSNSSDFGTSLKYPRFVKQDSNATVFLQQATHYAMRYRTPFVALCDYNTLILLVMTKVEKNHGGQYTYLTMVENPSKMRKAYLGFLLAAKLHAQNNNDWRKSREGEDLFAKGETWKQEILSDELRKQAERTSRNPNPIHDVSSSQDTDATVVEDG